MGQREERKNIEEEDDDDREYFLLAVMQHPLTLAVLINHVKQLVEKRCTVVIKSELRHCTMPLWTRDGVHGGAREELELPIRTPRFVVTRRRLMLQLAQNNCEHLTRFSFLECTYNNGIILIVFKQHDISEVFSYTILREKI